jgi:ribosomal protein L11 methylase PrmA
MSNNQVIRGSFRDPSGFLFVQDRKIYRQINLSYKDHYDHLLNSGLYRILSQAGILISHEEADIIPQEPAIAYKILQPEAIPFISYPYEWCFSQLRQAALLTLKIQKVALEYGMSLKDASAYNIQFSGGKAVFIDTLSFEKYPEDRPWVAYKQFCQHFLAPLGLMRFKDVRLNQLLRTNIDGVPLDLASSILPPSTYLRFGILSHIHLHARTQRRYADQAVSLANYKMSRKSLLILIDSLKSVITSLKYKYRPTEWGEYYDKTNYSQEAFASKKQIVEKYLVAANPGMVWDLGANVGTFSRLASDAGIYTLAFDLDPLAVEKNYQECAQKRESRLLPLLLDVTNPSPGTGWANSERMSLESRGPADTLLCLGLIHHLAISNNLPLAKVAEFLATLGKSLIIEFVPKSDSQVQSLLKTREDIFPDYTRDAFEAAFERYFSLQDSARITDSERIIYFYKIL